ncbi:MAG: ATP-binding cassette domain-containing protein [Lachnospiraceae bacterium]|nr:ATP-binding cassette domain-containing protein [Lachnospiraceae bacterium]
MKIRAFSKTYNGKTVLKTEDMFFGKGKIYAVIGANGSGKSTFAKIISAIEKADDGRSVTDGESIGYMSQKSFPFRMSVKENVMLKVKDETLADTLMEWLEIKHLSEHNAKGLSGGETARMALARILMEKYDMVIFDEPCASMDMKSTLLSEEIIRDYCGDKECVVILITHSLSQAKRVADEIIFINEGRIVEQGETQKILENPEKEETREFIRFYGI